MNAPFWSPYASIIGIVIALFVLMGIAEWVFPIVYFIITKQHAKRGLWERVLDREP
jgi:hypothetical protein